MRWLALGILLHPVPSWAQQWFGGVSKAVKAGVEQKRITIPAPRSPLEPSGFSQSGEEVLPAPQNAEDEASGKFEIVSAEDQYRTGNRVGATFAEVLFRGYRLKADEVQGDLESRIFILKGHARLEGKDLISTGERIIVDVRRKTFQAFSGRSTLGPKFVKGGVTEDIFVRGEEAEGDEGEVRATIARLTSCTLEDHPHYDIDSRSLTIRPGKRAILRHAKIKVGGKTILSLPYLSIPLNERFYRYLPVIGQTPDEGYFAKFRFGVPLPGENNLDLRPEFFTKKGVGLGLDLDYLGRNAEGSLDLYGLFGQQPSVQVFGNHLQRIRGATLSLDGSFQRDNYLFAPTATVSSLRSYLETRLFGASSSRITYLRNSSDSGSFATTNQTFGFSDSRNWNKNFRTSLDLSEARTDQQSSGGNTVRQEVDVSFRAEQELRKAQAQLEYQRTIPVGSTGGFFGSSDRTPVISLLSDAKRLFGDKTKLPNFRTETSWGEFIEGTNGPLSRSFFDFQLDRPDLSSKRLRMDWNTRFRQGIYSDDTAQYVVDAGSTVSYRLGADTSANLRYSTLRPFGFSPLAIDQTSQSDYLSADLSFRPLRSLLLGAETAYDFVQLGRGETSWQSVGVRAEYKPTNYLQFRSSSLYDTFARTWSDIRLDLGYRPGATFVGATARYDAVRHTWGSLNLYVDGLKMGRLKTTFLLQYNGFLKKFESRHFSFTYNMTDCTEAILQIIDNPLGFRSGTQVQFFIRIKAFPFATPFGTGSRGQPLGLGGGVGF